MEATRKLSRKIRVSLAAAATCALAVISSCSHAPQSKPQETPSDSAKSQPSSPSATGETYGPQEAYGPATESPGPSYGPDPILIKPVILVLGPGMARGFAYVGVIRALNEAKIRIGAIYGTEIGAVIGTLYGMSETINQFEWALLRLKEDALGEKKGIFSRIGKRQNDGSKLHDELVRILGKKDLADAKIPVRIGLQAEDSGLVTVLDHGPASEAVRAAYAVPGLFEHSEWGGIKVVAPVATRPFLVSDARELGLGPVVLIDVSEHTQSAKFAETSGADIVITPDMKGIGPLDFTKRTDAAFRGKSAVSAKLPEIRQWVGLPPADTSQDGSKGGASP